LVTHAEVVVEQFYQSFGIWCRISGDGGGFGRPTEVRQRHGDFEAPNLSQIDGRFSMYVINQNRFRRVFGTPPMGLLCWSRANAAGGTEWRSGLPFPTAVCHAAASSNLQFTAALWEGSETASEFHAERSKPKAIKCVGLEADALLGACVLSEVDVTSCSWPSAELPVRRMTAAN